VKQYDNHKHWSYQLHYDIVHDKTLPYSPYQNGKQEAFWGTLEGRLMEMLDGCAELTLDFLNTATQAWVEIEYNRAVKPSSRRCIRWTAAPTPTAAVRWSSLSRATGHPLAGPRTPASDATRSCPRC
jgi:hypothetical protein